jgi:hypothetical protein
MERNGKGKWRRMEREEKEREKWREGETEKWREGEKERGRNVQAEWTEEAGSILIVTEGSQQLTSEPHLNKLHEIFSFRGGDIISIRRRDNWINMRRNWRGRRNNRSRDGRSARLLLLLLLLLSGRNRNKRVEDPACGLEKGVVIKAVGRNT